MLNIGWVVLYFVFQKELKDGVFMCANGDNTFRAENNTDRDSDID
jgi:hypothetical protein